MSKKHYLSPVVNTHAHCMCLKPKMVKKLCADRHTSHFLDTIQIIGSVFLTHDLFSFDIVTRTVHCLILSYLATDCLAQNPCADRHTSHFLDTVQFMGSVFLTCDLFSFDIATRTVHCLVLSYLAICTDCLAQNPTIKICVTECNFPWKHQRINFTCIIVGT